MPMRDSSLRPEGNLETRMGKIIGLEPHLDPSAARAPQSFVLITLIRAFREFSG